MASAPISLATAADLALLGPDARAEVIGGVIVEKAAPSPDHADAQTGLIGEIRSPFHRRKGEGPPGGWWILAEVDVELTLHDVYRPDIAGWRRDRVPERVRAEPFEEIELRVGALFGLEEEETVTENPGA